MSLKQLLIVIVWKVLGYIISIASYETIFEHNPITTHPLSTYELLGSQSIYINYSECQFLE